MCWPLNYWNMCYECSKKFNETTTTTITTTTAKAKAKANRYVPCYHVENGQPCPGLQETRDVEDWTVVCESCRSARRAEEACQQAIYRMKPLVWEHKKYKKTLKVKYQHDIERRRGRAARLLQQQQQQHVSTNSLGWEKLE
ncbi:hypothetical protein F4778DRAFT_477242 [Xylariomycetidae sp. FL2044]|nr:hypothetical protein F4778DRAFT_477242 [Xylariomycetidae sp. FL2044]